MPLPEARGPLVAVGAVEFPEPELELEPEPVGYATPVPEGLIEPVAETIFVAAEARESAFATT